MEYAAIIIPTLNRIHHLKRCIESLKANSLASKTEIYISVDYPPNEKYNDGYQEVKEYVNTITGFLKVNVYLQENNLGPGLNGMFLYNQIKEKYDKFVFTEDDNEFSTNFLEYINWGLEKYKNDENIYAICSCSDFINAKHEFAGDYYVIQAYNPYGKGGWVHKYEKLMDFLVQKNINKRIYRSLKMQRKILEMYPKLYSYLANDSLRRIPEMRGRNGNITIIDVWENIYILVNDLYCIKPTYAKSRNWGLDGSGVHSDASHQRNYVPSVMLDNSTNWSLNPERAPQDAELENMKSHYKKFSISDEDRRSCKRLFIMNYMLGNNLLYFLYKIWKKIKKQPAQKYNDINYG